jgi:hypothetical protein
MFSHRVVVAGGLDAEADDADDAGGGADRGDPLAVAHAAERPPITAARAMAIRAML